MIENTVNKPESRGKKFGKSVGNFFNKEFKNIDSIRLNINKTVTNVQSFGKTLPTTEIIDRVENAEYTDLFGGSIIFTGLYIIVFFIICIVLFSYTHLRSYQKEWETIKCFSFFPILSGIINPKEGQSIVDSIGETYKQCATEIVDTTPAIQDNVRNLQSAKRSIEQAKMANTDGYREIVNEIEIDTENNKRYFNDVESMVKFFGMYGQKMYSGMYDMYGKFMGTIFSILYAVESGYYSIRGFMVVLKEASIFTLTAMGTFIVSQTAYFVALVGRLIWALLTINQNTTKLVLSQLAITVMFMFFGFIVIPILAYVSIFMIILIDLSSTVLDTTACFGEDTSLELLNGTTRKIQDINLNEVLADGSVVVSLIKVPYNKYRDKLVSIDGIIVTSEHNIKHRNQFIEVGSLRDSIKDVLEYTKTWLYCINTNTKQIQIGKHVFLDWDDMNYHERRTYENNLHIVKHSNSFYYNHLYVNMISGLDGNTKVKMFNGDIKCVCELESGDLTDNKEVVFGVMRVSGKYSPLVTTNMMKSIKHTANIAFQSKDKQDAYDENMVIKTSQFVDTIYHVITSKGTITIIDDDRNDKKTNTYTIFDYDKTNERVLYHKKSWREIYNPNDI